MLIENISISVNENQPLVRVNRQANNIPEDGILVRNLFTLAGTQTEVSSLRQLPNPLQMPTHPGYASVGTVVGIGGQNQRFHVGQNILLSAQYNTYVSFCGAQLQQTAQAILQPLPPQLDPVRATFLPLVSYACYLRDQVSLVADAPVVLLGFSLLGAIFRRVLQIEEGENNEIWVTAVQSQQLSGLMRDFQPIIRAPNSPLPAKYVYVLLTPEWQAAAYHQETVSAINEPSPGKPVWLRYDTLQRAIQLLTNDRLVLNDLIAEHIHAEALTHLEPLGYQGQGIIYDW